MVIGVVGVRVEVAVSGTSCMVRQELRPWLYCSRGIGRSRSAADEKSQAIVNGQLMTEQQSPRQ